MIVIAWILALLLALPLAPMAMKAVNYNIDASGVKNLPSQVAQDYINQNFNGITAQGSSTVILIQTPGASIFSDEVKHSIQNVTKEIAQASADGKINANVTLTSLYSSVHDYTVVYIDQIGPLYSLAENYSAVLPLFLYQVPLIYWDSFNNTQDALLIEYAMPKAYYDYWLLENQTGGTIDQIDSRAYGDTRAWVDDVIEHRASLNDTEAMLLRTYLADFTHYWNATSGDPEYTSQPDRRLDKAMEGSYLVFMEHEAVKGIGILPLLYLTVAHDSFDLNDCQDFHRISQFNEVIFQTVLDGVLGIMPDEIRDDCLLYFDTFYGQWNASAAPPGVPQFRNYTDFAANITSDMAGSPVKELIDSFYYELGWERRLDLQAIRSVTIEFLSNYTHTKAWLVRQIIDLGDNPDAGAVEALASHLVENSTVPDYPLPMLPLISIMTVGKNNDSTIILVGYTHGGKYTSGMSFVPTVRDIVGKEFKGQASVETYVTGMDAMTYDQAKALDEDLGIVDPVAIILILVLIGLFFNSVLAAALPPAAIGMGLGISFGALYLIAHYVFSVNFLVITLMITASLGAGCDYCIFMLSRYREERRNGRSKDEAVEEAVTWAGETVATSGATVMIGFGSLFLASLDMIKSFGTLVIGIVLALLISLTLVPALLHIFGDKLFWPSKGPRPQSKIGQRYFHHAATSSIKHAKVLLVAAIVISIPATYVMVTASSSYDLIESMPSCEAKNGIESMEDSFGGGMIQPTSIGMEMSGSVVNPDGSFNVTQLNAVENMSRRIAAIPGVEKLLSPTRPYGQSIDYGNISRQYTVEAAAAIVVMQKMVGKGNDSVLITIIFQEDPFTKQNIDNINHIRAMADKVNYDEPNILAAYVGGGTASIYDVATTTTADFTHIILLAIVLIYIVLLLVLGSVLNPLRSILTILLSISWTVALTSIVFQAWMGMSLNFLVPLILIVVCLGLGMDYDVLLSTRIREEVHKGMSTNEAIEHSMLQTGGIITACGVIMASAFGSLLLTGNPMLMQFGMALMIAIVLDAVIVRTYLVPAIMSLMGKWNWWAPKRLQRGGEKKE